MAKNVSQLTQVAPNFQVRRGAVKCESSIEVRYVAKAIFDTAGNDSSGASNKTIAAHGTGVFLPIGAIITKVFFQTKTGFTSAANTGTIAIKAVNANDLVTAAAVSGGGFNTAGFTAGIPDGTAASYIGLTAEKEIIVTVAVQALTAGKLIVFVEYMLGL